MSRLLVAVLAVSLVAPIASLAVAQAVSEPPRTRSSAPPIILQAARGAGPIPAGQPHAFLAPRDGATTGPMISNLGAQDAEAVEPAPRPRRIGR